MNNQHHGFKKLSILKILIPSLALAVLITWSYFVPSGLLGKADAIGYAVCHRIPERSFSLGDRQLPLCARCSGMHLGALLGMLYQLRYGKKGGMPARKFMAILAGFLVMFGVDGVNSYVVLLRGTPILYEPQNWLRLITGTLLGLGIAAMLYPVFNQSAWIDFVNEPALKDWRQMAELLLLCGVLVLAVLSENPLLLYPLALLSAANVVLVLSLIYAIVWMMLFKRENSYRTIKEAWAPLTGGFAVAVLQIAVMDLARYMFTGTWGGFVI